MSRHRLDRPGPSPAIGRMQCWFYVIRCRRVATRGIGPPGGASRADGVGAVVADVRHDLSEFCSVVPNPDGTFRSEWLQSAIDDPGWTAYLVRKQDRPVGLALDRARPADTRPQRVLHRAGCASHRHRFASGSGGPAEAPRAMGSRLPSRTRRRFASGAGLPRTQQGNAGPRSSLRSPRSQTSHPTCGSRSRPQTPHRARADTLDHRPSSWRCRHRWSRCSTGRQCGPSGSPATRRNWRPSPPLHSWFRISRCTW